VHLHVQLELATDVDAAGRMVADRAYAEEKGRAMGAVEQQVDVVGDPAGAFTVTARRALPTDDIPPHVRPFVGQQLDVRQIEAWEAPSGAERHGTVAVEITGAPVRLTGTMVLAPAGDGASTLTYDGELKASIPLFGAAVEQAAGQAIEAGLQAEGRVAADWIARH
jgi:hypothetical protein